MWIGIGIFVAGFVVGFIVTVWWYPECDCSKYGPNMEG